ncbi:hypothetical protein JJO83_13640 [Halomonas aquamarina]|uniref:hypothetical protein n=1 Tax=Vreelandella aquamarina TaxID=77097 RepID=UPI0023594322|nr:hypothetical protein [Halomonas aquamarina]MDC8443725.1 hypothetical protein [Halomonas aquamarina]
MSKERPILFNADMVNAILSGRKTQTRRIVKPTKDRNGSGCHLAPCEIAGEVNGGDYALCPYGQPGDRLWVRENFLYLMHGDVTAGDIKYCASIDSRSAAGSKNPGYWWRKRPSIHMPRWASRITLEIVSVRVERLKQISERDALQEGIGLVLADNWPDPKAMSEAVAKSRRAGFKLLWESINGSDSWDTNPWVWVVEFKRVEASQ